MYPRYHILIGFLVSASVYLIFPGVGLAGFLIIFLSSFLIDVDHYVYYLFSKKDWSLKNALLTCKKIDKKSRLVPKKDRKNFYSGLYFLHGSEAIIILVVLSFFSNIFLFVLIGFLIHQVLDMIELITLNESPDKLISFFYSVYRKKYKKPYLIT